LWRRAIPLDPDRLTIMLARGEEAQQISVALRATTYRCRLLEVREGEPGEWHGRLHCYELDSDAPYTWAVWSPFVLGMFRLFPDQGGQNYLAWVSGSNVEIAEVSQPRDRCVALNEYFVREHRRVAFVPVGELLPMRPFLSPNPQYWAIRVLSIAEHQPGNWTVKISGPDSPEVYTLVSEGGQWHRQE